jgi:hypothetical protein
MHYVSRIDEATVQIPKLYKNQSTGFCRAAYVERAMGSVYMSTGICYLDAIGPKNTRSLDEGASCEI